MWHGERIRRTPIFPLKSLIGWWCHLPKQETRLLGGKDGFSFECTEFGKPVGPPGRGVQEVTGHL